MTEREIMEKIKKSAEEIEIPERLSPENMKKQLDEAQKSGLTEAEKAAGGSVVKRNSGAWHWNRMGKTVAAAAVCLVCGAGLFAGYRTMRGNQSGLGVTGALEMAVGSDGVEEAGMPGMNGTDNAAAAESAGNQSENDDSATGIGVIPKKDAGELYVVAADYEQIYDRLKAVDDEQKRQMIMNDIEDAMNDLAGALTGGALKEEIAYESAAPMESPAESGAVMENESAAADSAAGGAANYSKTNLQTQGVDESDIIKTDGSYLYIVRDYTVEMIDIRGSRMKAAGTIQVPLGSGADRVVEMYVDGDKLSLIIEREETSLTQGESPNGGRAAAGAGTRAAGGSVDVAEEQTVMADYAMKDVYYVNSARVTELATYDITDRKNPIQKGSIAQDGSYNTSRKIGDIVYLFTEKSVVLPETARRMAVTEENAGSWIPLVDGKAVPADCIYLPERGNNGLLISSVNVKRPDQIVDNTLIMNNYVDIYVSTGALYLYNSNYSGERVTTEIAKFSLDKGKINAVGAAAAGGDVYDTFAINEYQGKLRLLTTDWSGRENENQLYLFDKNMKLTGSLTGIAKGEQIYAARYFGDMAYFVTYRNTDPLFAVDLSDDKNPKILSELKITGFSEYLHFWGEDKLVGIGYETDPNTGERKGLKLTMFDISNPAELKTAGTLVIGNMGYSPALYNYKCVLADGKENLIGFAAESYKAVWESDYFLFSWEDGKFKELLTENLVGRADRGGVNLEQYRGIYVGDKFYLVHPDSVTSYDREDNYKLIEKYLP